MLVPKNEWPFIRYIHMINKCTMYRVMGLAPAQSADSESWTAPDDSDAVT